MFDQQGKDYRDAVLPRGVPRVAVEAGVSDYWRKYVGLEGAVVGIDRFGECGPAAQVFDYLGITAAKVAEAVERRHRRLVALSSKRPGRSGSFFG